MDKTLKALVAEVTQLANDLATKSVFSLEGDLPVVGDAMKRSVNELVSLDARVTALEHKILPPVSVPPSLTEGSKP